MQSMSFDERACRGCRWSGTHVPCVRFVNGRTAVCHPEVFTAVVAGVGTCIRIQTPLKCAWVWCSSLHFVKFPAPGFGLSGILPNRESQGWFSTETHVSSLKIIIKIMQLCIGKLVDCKHFVRNGCQQHNKATGRDRKKASLTLHALQRCLRRRCF